MAMAGCVASASGSIAEGCADTVAGMHETVPGDFLDESLLDGEIEDTMRRYQEFLADAGKGRTRAAESTAMVSS
jgi:hypothetical protein